MSPAREIAYGAAIAFLGFVAGVVANSDDHAPSPDVTVWRDTTEHVTCFLRDSGAISCLWDSERPAR